MHAFRFVLGVALLGMASGCVEVSTGYTREDAPWERNPVPRVPHGNIKVTLDTFEVSEEERSALDLALKFSDASVVVAVGDAMRRNGIRVIAGRKNFVASFRAETEKFKSVSSTSGFVLVADGHQASLAVISQMPKLDPIEIPIYGDSDRPGRVVRMVQTGSGFVVEARQIEGRMVDLKLTPWFADDNGREVTFTEVSTHLAVEPERPYAVWGMETEQSTVGSWLFSRRTATGRRRILQTVTVEVP